MTHPLRTVLLLATTTLAPLALGACGSTSASPRPAAERAAVTTPAGPRLTRRAVSRELGNGFRLALSRLAIMDQQADDASTLAPDLPAGSVRDVRCADAAPARWRCTVSWRSVGGAALGERYAVRTERGRCFVAVADPQRPTRYDATTRAYGEDPRNVLSSARRGC